MYKDPFGDLIHKIAYSVNHTWPFEKANRGLSQLEILFFFYILFLFLSAGGHF